MFHQPAFYYKRDSLLFPRASDNCAQQAELTIPNPVLYQSPFSYWSHVHTYTVQNWVYQELYAAIQSCILRISSETVARPQHQTRRRWKAVLQMENVSKCLIAILRTLLALLQIYYCTFRHTVEKLIPTHSLKLFYCIHDSAICSGAWPSTTLYWRIGECRYSSMHKLGHSIWVSSKRVSLNRYEPKLNSFYLQYKI
jgi:hypothetical protein